MIGGRKVFGTATLIFGLMSGFASAQFETRASLPVLSNPISIATGDFNRDGKLDLAVAAFFNGKVAVLLGRGDGTFEPATYYTVGANETTGSIVAASLRREGLLDLIVTNDLSNEVQVLFGKGDGTFEPALAYSTPNYPAAVELGDFTGDHKLDVVTVDESGYCPCISLLLGNGDGTFQEPPIITMPPVTPVAVGIGDFNRDGKLDLVSIDQFGSTNQADILLGNGDGTFTQGESYDIGSDPQSVAVADFNGDGKLDLAIADSFAGSVDILLGNGNGTFRQGETLPASFAAEIVAADLNGDGRQDLIVLTGVYSTTLNIFYGNGDGTFQKAISFPAGGHAAAPAVGDFNGDGRKDIVLANYLGNAVITFLNTGVVTFTPNAPLNFNKQSVGTKSAPQTVKFTNTGKTALKISTMKVTGQFGMTSTCATSVAAGKTCSISVTFSPTTQGAKSGTITIEDSASSKPQVIVLSGTGT